MLAKTRPPALRKTMNAAEVRVIAVLGAGQMGAGIAQVAAAQGFRVTLSDVSVERATSGRDKILKSLDRLVEKGKIERSVRETVAQNIEPLTFDEAVGPADLVIEAAPENLALKLDLFGRAEARAKPDAVFASNTSSISITRLAAHTKRADRFFGMHFFNPVPLMKLVELVRGVATSPETMELGRALATRLDKLVIVSEDRPGFLVNRMLLPLLNEACFALQEGVGTAEDIDQGARLGLNHPMGPLELADFVGLDTVLAIADVLQREFGDDKYRPAMLLKNLVAAGFLGKKAGRGFYRYDAQGQRIVPGAGS
jgi:3-hydroxybutyryl-CoA dehydrogenase